MADKLLPCPFCGGEGKYHGSYFEDDVCEYVSCTRCNASTPLMYKKGESIEWWNRRPSAWHTGTPTEEGYYLCKVFYDKETKNDMRILEWVKELDCFCIPYSKVRAYHYYVGENNGENVEVVYEWQKLDMRFRMETKWIDPYKE